LKPSIAFLAGAMTAGELELWAERFEMAEDVEYADDDREAVADALFQLANPALNGAITTQRALEIRRGLSEWEQRHAIPLHHLLWLTLVVAMAIGWWVDHRRSNFLTTAIVEPSQLNAKGLELLYETFSGQEHVYLAFNSRKKCLIIIAPPDQIEQIQSVAKGFEPIGE
jgi:hypothetical protein